MVQKRVLAEATMLTGVTPGQLWNSVLTDVFGRPTLDKELNHSGLSSFNLNNRNILLHLFDKPETLFSEMGKSDFLFVRDELTFNKIRALVVKMQAAQFGVRIERYAGPEQRLPVFIQNNQLYVPEMLIPDALLATAMSNLVKEVPGLRVERATAPGSTERQSYLVVNKDKFQDLVAAIKRLFPGETYSLTVLTKASAFLAHEGVLFNLPALTARENYMQSMLDATLSSVSGFSKTYSVHIPIALTVEGSEDLYRAYIDKYYPEISALVSISTGPRETDLSVDTWLSVVPERLFINHHLLYLRNFYLFAQALSVAQDLGSPVALTAGDSAETVLRFETLGSKGTPRSLPLPPWWSGEFVRDKKSALDVAQSLSTFYQRSFLFEQERHDEVFVYFSSRFYPAEEDILNCREQFTRVEHHGAATMLFDGPLALKHNAHLAVQDGGMLRVYADSLKAKGLVLGTCVLAEVADSTDLLYLGDNAGQAYSFNAVESEERDWHGLSSHKTGHYEYSTVKLQSEIIKEDESYIIPPQTDVKMINFVSVLRQVVPKFLELGPIAFADDKAYIRQEFSRVMGLCAGAKQSEVYSMATVSELLEKEFKQPPSLIVLDNDFNSWKFDKPALHEQFEPVYDELSTFFTEEGEAGFGTLIPKFDSFNTDPLARNSVEVAVASLAMSTELQEAFLKQWYTSRDIRKTLSADEIKALRNAGANSMHALVEKYPNTTIIFFIRDALSKVEYIQRIIQEAGFEQKVFLCYKKDVTASTTTWGPFVNKMYSVAKRLGLIK